jgi:hypothetical protein
MVFIIVRHLKEFHSVFGRLLISLNIPLRKDEAYYAFSQRVGGIMPPRVGISLQLLKSQPKNTLPIPKNLTPMSCDLSMIEFIITFSSCFMMGEDHGFGNIVFY